MRATCKLAAVVAAAALLAVPAVSAGDHRGSYRDPLGGRDLDVVGLTADGRLISFDSNRPGRAKTGGGIRGLTMDTRLVGIDYRPASGNDGDSGDLYCPRRSRRRGRATTTAGRPSCARARTSP